MRSITKQSIKLTTNNIKILNKAGIRVPPNAKTCKYIGVSTKNADVDTYVFKNNDGLLIRELKYSTDPKTEQKTAQLRCYKYLGESNKNRKLSEINQYNFNCNNQCIDTKKWRFYHLGKSEPIFYSRQSTFGYKDNFIKADNSLVDANGLKITPISTAEFINRKQDLGRKKFVDAPWTIKESVTADKVVTDSVQECTVVGFIGEKGVSLDHFNPNNPENYDVAKLESFMKEQIKLQGNNVKAFVVGSCEKDIRSDDQFNAIIDFLAVNKIPFSSYKTGDKVLYGGLERARFVKGLNYGKQIKQGLINPEYCYVGQNIIYNGNNEILLNNTIIDKELRKGNYDAKSLVKMSFSKIG